MHYLTPLLPLRHPKFIMRPSNDAPVASGPVATPPAFMSTHRHNFQKFTPTVSGIGDAQQGDVNGFFCHVCQNKWVENGIGVVSKHYSCTVCNVNVHTSCRFLAEHCYPCTANKVHAVLSFEDSMLKPLRISGHFSVRLLNAYDLNETLVPSGTNLYGLLTLPTEEGIIRTSTAIKGESDCVWPCSGAGDSDYMLSYGGQMHEASPLVLRIELWRSVMFVFDSIVASTEVSLLPIMYFPGGIVERWFGIASPNGEKCGAVLLRIQFMPSDPLAFAASTLPSIMSIIQQAAEALTPAPSQETVSTILDEPTPAITVPTLTEPLQVKIDKAKKPDYVVGLASAPTAPIASVATLPQRGSQVEHHLVAELIGPSRAGPTAATTTATLSSVSRSSQEPPSAMRIRSSSANSVKSTTSDVSSDAGGGSNSNAGNKRSSSSSSSTAAGVTPSRLAQPKDVPCTPAHDPSVPSSAPSPASDSRRRRETNNNNRRLGLDLNTPLSPRMLTQWVWALGARAQMAVESIIYEKPEQTVGTGDESPSSPSPLPPLGGKETTGQGFKRPRRPLKRGVGRFYVHLVSVLRSEVSDAAEGR